MTQPAPVASVRRYGQRLGGDQVASRSSPPIASRPCAISRASPGDAATAGTRARASVATRHQRKTQIAAAVALVVAGPALCSDAWLADRGCRYTAGVDAFHHRSRLAKCLRRCCGRLFDIRPTGVVVFQGVDADKIVRVHVRDPTDSARGRSRNRRHQSLLCAGWQRQIVVKRRYVLTLDGAGADVGRVPAGLLGGGRPTADPSPAAMRSTRLHGRRHVHGRARTPRRAKRRSAGRTTWRRPTRCCSRTSTKIGPRLRMLPKQREDEDIRRHHAVLRCGSIGSWARATGRLILATDPATATVDRRTRSPPACRCARRSSCMPNTPHQQRHSGDGHAPAPTRATRPP